MKRLICISIALILLAATPVMAIDGNILKHYADADDKLSSSYGSGLFVGYVLGVREETLSKLCIPEGVIHGQSLDVIKKYLNDHPEELHLPASALILKAIQAAWPCEKKEQEP